VCNLEQTWHRENAVIAQRLQKGSFEAVPSARWGPKMESWLNGAEESMEVSGKGDAVKTYSKQYRHLATIITGVGLTFFSITAKAETIGYEQSPGHFGGFFANLADEFQLDQSALIRNITWWGGYLSGYSVPPPVADNVIIRLFADHSGKPGVLLGDFHVGNDVNRVATGDFVTPLNPLTPLLFLMVFRGGQNSSTLSTFLNPFWLKRIRATGSASSMCQ